MVVPRNRMRIHGPIGQRMMTGQRKWGKRNGLGGEWVLPKLDWRHGVAKELLRFRSEG